jgi:WD40 repeat protein
MTKLSQEPFKLVGHKGRVFGVQFSPDSQWLATAAEDNTIRLWNPSEPQAAPVILQGHNSAVGPLAGCLAAVPMLVSGESMVKT